MVVYVIAPDIDETPAQSSVIVTYLAGVWITTIPALVPDGGIVVYVIGPEIDDAPV